MSQDSEDDDIVCLSSGHLGRRQPKRIKREDGTPESSFSQPDRFHQAPENARSSCSPTPSTSSVRRSTPVSDVEVFDMTLSSISTIEEDATLIEPDVTSLQKAKHDASGKHLSGSPENTTSKPQIAFAKAGIIPLEDDSLVAKDEVLGPCYKLFLPACTTPFRTLRYVNNNYPAALRGLKLERTLLPSDFRGCYCYFAAWTLIAMAESSRRISTTPVPSRGFSSADVVVREGFICPICMQDLGSIDDLQDHFESDHAEEDKTLLQQLKGMVLKRIGRAESPVPLKSSHTVSSDDEGAANNFIVWDEQTLGTRESHTEYFKKIRSGDVK